MSDDPQKTKLYRAEQSVRRRYGQVDLLPSPESFRTAHTRVVGSDWWSDNVGKWSQVEISGRMHARATTTGGNIVKVGRKPEASWSWSLLVLAHELGHVAHDRRPFEAAHSPMFAAWQIVMTRAIIGEDAARSLKYAFMTVGVDVAASPVNDYPEVPLIGHRGSTTPAVDADFAARRAARLAEARENRQGMIAASQIFS